VGQQIVTSLFSFPGLISHIPVSVSQAIFAYPFQGFCIS